MVTVGCLEENTVLRSNAGEIFITGSGRHGQLGISWEEGDEGDEETKELDEEDIEKDRFIIIPKLSTRLNVKID